jgi:hypothetical protein
MDRYVLEPVLDEYTRTLDDGTVVSVRPRDHGYNYCAMFRVRRDRDQYMPCALFVIREQGELFVAEANKRARALEARLDRLKAAKEKGPKDPPGILSTCVAERTQKLPQLPGPDRAG